jgi:uncharacterized protein YecT (DUF1311 family)
LQKEQHAWLKLRHTKVFDVMIEAFEEGGSVI